MTFEILGCLKLFLILSACSHCRCIQVSIPESQYEVARGSDITLPCSFSPARPNYEMFILKWEVVQDNKATIVAIFYSNLNRVDVSPGYEGRASLDVDSSTRTGALHLTKVTMEENGNFQCNVLIPGDDEGTPSASTFLLVLVAPSSPICRIEGKAEYWHNITLTCLSEEGSPEPLYNWKSYSVDNTPRPFPPKTTEKAGALSLFNISREMSGFYICTSANRIASASCNLTLAVMPGGSMGGATAGIIGGVVGAVLLLALVIFCCCRHKKKKAKYTEGSPGEMEFHDRDDIKRLDGYQENKIPNNHDIDIIGQTQHSEKTGIDKLNDDVESMADSQKVVATRIALMTNGMTVVAVEIALTITMTVEIVKATIVAVEIALTITMTVKIIKATIVAVEIVLMITMMVQIVTATIVAVEIALTITMTAEIVKATIVAVEIALMITRVIEIIKVTIVAVEIGLMITVAVEIVKATIVAVEIALTIIGPVTIVLTTIVAVEIALTTIVAVEIALMRVVITTQKEAGMNSCITGQPLETQYLERQ